MFTPQDARSPNTTPPAKELPILKTLKRKPVQRQGPKSGGFQDQENTRKAQSAMHLIKALDRPWNHSLYSVPCITSFQTRTYSNPQPRSMVGSLPTRSPIAASSVRFEHPLGVAVRSEYGGQRVLTKVAGPSGKTLDDRSRWSGSHLSTCVSPIARERTYLVLRSPLTFGGSTFVDIFAGSGVTGDVVGSI